MHNYFNIKVAILIMLSGFCAFPSTAQTAVDSRHDHTIRILIDGEEWSATLKDSDATKDFIKTLPLYITLKDYSGTEKVSGLPERLSTGDTPAGSEASVGDIAYYAPWGYLAFFIEEVEYRKGLVILGHIEDNLEAFLETLKVSDAVDVRIDLIE
ncbi:cyclophilin-like fold protein [Marinilabilia sp.]|uniref:cyclophilin-like fold protein n=1 Tax=Marinilabilia sp. TaxID=2021252 RepID=UPI0025BD07AC|nr:cyclophilin-like fold protein [Marinilabilia sp.]